MKVVIHIGAPKTGSTAIQSAFSANRDQLLEHGILYPRLRMAKTNHTLLTAGIYREDVPIGRLIRPRVMASGKTRHEVYQEDISYLKEQIEMARPSCMVLSSEAFFRSWKKMRFEQFLKDCGVFPGDVSIVAYLRNPADRYLSLAQQGLKYSSKFKRPDAYPFRAVLKGYIDHFPGRVHIRLHEPGVDVVDDLANLVSPELPPLERDTTRSNETVSAEVMQLVQDFRLEHYPDCDNEVVPAATQLWLTLSRFEHELGKKRRPRLKAHVREHILSRSRRSVEWLRGQLGQDVDWLAGSEGTSSSVDFVNESVRVADICELDESYLDELRELAARPTSRSERKLKRQRRREQRKQQDHPVQRNRVLGWLRNLFYMR